MKAKTKDKIAKGFALIVVLVMIFQVFLPLFSSNVIATQTQANLDAQNAAAQASTTPQVTVGDETATPATTTTIENSAKPVGTSATPATSTK